MKRQMQKGNKCLYLLGRVTFPFALTDPCISTGKCSTVNVCTQSLKNQGNVCMYITGTVSDGFLLYIKQRTPPFSCPQPNEYITREVVQRIDHITMSELKQHRIADRWKQYYSEANTWAEQQRVLPNTSKTTMSTPTDNLHPISP